MERTADNKKTVILVAAVIFCAIFARVMSKLDFYPSMLGLIRTMLYISLYLSWGFSIRRRVIQPKVRGYLTGVAALMIFWFTVRTCKYFFVSDENVIRYLWYSYYIPMLLIPLLAVFVAISLGKPEKFCLPKWTGLLYLPTMLLLLLVFTNDLHQFVFSFPAGEIWSDRNNRIELGYFFVLGWEVLCAVSSLVLILFKSRQSHQRRYLPVGILCCSVVYALIYISGVEWMQILAGDITAAQCLLFAGIFESCIQCGLISTNTGYDLLFEVGNLNAQITDEEDCVCFLSANAPKLPPGSIREAYQGTVSLDENTRLNSHVIPGGHVLWVEDITDLRIVLEELEANREAIEESNHLALENYRTKCEISALREKNRLYDLLQEQTTRQIELLNDILSRYNGEENQDIRHALLAKAAVICAYIKRRGNLLFIGEKEVMTDTFELALCLEESFSNLELLKIECAMDIPKRDSILVSDGIYVYDFFESAIEISMDSLRSVWLKARSLRDRVSFHLEIESEADLSGLCGLADSSIYEDGVWNFTLRVRKEGEDV